MANNTRATEGRAALAKAQLMMLDELGPPANLTLPDAALWWARQWTTDETEQKQHVAACLAIGGAPSPAYMRRQARCTGRPVQAYISRA